MFVLGAPCSGKTTIAGRLRGTGIEVIDTDDEIVRLNGGSWPDIEMKNERLLPLVLDAAVALDEVIVLNSYLPLASTRQLRERGFSVALLDVSDAELRRRDAVRFAAEGWTNREWFDWHQEVIREHHDAGLIDHLIDGEQSPQRVAAALVALLGRSRHQAP